MLKYTFKNAVIYKSIYISLYVLTLFWDDFFKYFKCALVRYSHYFMLHMLYYIALICTYFFTTFMNVIYLFRIWTWGTTPYATYLSILTT